MLCANITRWQHANGWTSTLTRCDSVGGVLTLNSFETDYHYDDESATRTSSLSVGLQQLGAFVACFIAWPLTDRLGRKKTLMLSSLVFCIGALIQTINTHSLAAFYVARVIAGLGLGAATVVVPMFNSEMTPKELRGQVGSFFQLFFTLVSYSYFLLDDGAPSLLSMLPGHFCLLLDRLRRRQDDLEQRVPAMADPHRPTACSRGSAWTWHVHSEGEHAVAHQKRPP